MSRKHPDAKPPYPSPTRQDGTRGCRWCWGDLPKRRRTFCGDACVEQYRREHDWTYIRSLVFERDRGVCRLCGVDTEKIRRILRSLRRRCRIDVWLPGHASVALGRDHGGWEADHITPRHDGGGNQLDNLRTLCRACHKGVTREFARVRAERRRKDKSLWAEERR